MTNKYHTYLPALNSALEDGNLRLARNIAHDMHVAANEECKRSRLGTIEYDQWREKYDASETLWLTLKEACYALVTLGVYNNVVAKDNKEKPYLER